MLSELKEFKTIADRADRSGDRSYNRKEGDFGNLRKYLNRPFETIDVRG